MNVYNSLQMKVITAVVNNPIFIEIQYHTLKKYMKCEYEFIVFNDAKDFADFTNSGDCTIKTAIEQICRDLKIQCINIPNNHHKLKSNRLCQEPSFRTAESMNVIADYQRLNPDCYLLLDSDMFLIDDFDVEEYNKYDCSVILQNRKNIDTSDIYYIWNGLYYFNTRRLDMTHMNWHCTPTTDTGGMMYKWLHAKVSEFPNTNELKTNSNKIITNNGVRFLTYFPKSEWNMNSIPENVKNKNKKLIDFLIRDSRNSNGKFYCELYDNKFLHYRSGGNWEKKDLKFHLKLAMELKTALL
jgi:hypothetical protein